MTKTTAINKALKSARGGVDQIVFHWTDYPGDPGPNDYHVIDHSDYLCAESAAWIPESSVVFCSDGW